MKILIFTLGEQCSGCRQLERRLDTLKQGRPEVSEYLQTVNCEEDNEAVEFYQVQSVPTVICIDKSGAAVWRMAGYLPSNNYEEAILNQIKHKDDCDKFPQKQNGYERFAH